MYPTLGYVYTIIGILHAAVCRKPNLGAYRISSSEPLPRGSFEHLPCWSVPPTPAATRQAPPHTHPTARFSSSVDVQQHQISELSARSPGNSFINLSAASHSAFHL